MKPLKALFAVILFFSFAITFSAYAEEAKAPVKASADSSDALLIALGFPPKEQRVIPESLQEAFSQESEDQAQYLAFAEKADEEGQTESGKVFRALAHAKQPYLDYYAKTIEALGGTLGATAEAPIVKSTAENLKSAADNELYKSTQMYPSLLTRIQSSAPKDVLDILRNARKVAGAHASLFQEVSATGPSRIPVSAYNICSVCGYSFLEWAEVDTCPICGAPKEKFKKISA